MVNIWIVSCTIILDLRKCIEIIWTANKLWWYLGFRATFVYYDILVDDL